MCHCVTLSQLISFSNEMVHLNEYTATYIAVEAIETGPAQWGFLGLPEPEPGGDPRRPVVPQQ